MEMFDVLIFGAGVSGLSCAQVLGSAMHKDYAKDKKVGIIMHQKASMLQEAILNNAYGIDPGSLGADILQKSISNLAIYPDIIQLISQKVLQVDKVQDYWSITTSNSVLYSKIIVVAVNSSRSFSIRGLEQYVEEHKKSLPSKNRVQLKNVDHLVDTGVYVCGTLAGHASQFSIAAGSGASVATDILTLWNNGIATHSHDSIAKRLK